MKSGQDLLGLAAEHIGEEYIYGANVPLDNPDWRGPWDCAEFCTWVVKQIAGKIYGCLNNKNMDDPEPYTGGWKRDARLGTVKNISVVKAMAIPGAILLRYRQGAKHIVFGDGKNGTIEAKSTMFGVCRGRMGSPDSWDYGILIPGIKYKEI